MSSAVSLHSHTFTGQAKSSKRFTSVVHILSPETDNCPSWISGRERMTVENISWSISTKECCRPRRGLNPRPPGLQSDGASNWATEATMWRYPRICHNHKAQPSRATKRKKWGEKWRHIWNHRHTKKNYYRGTALVTRKITGVCVCAGVGMGDVLIKCSLLKWAYVIMF